MIDSNFLAGIAGVVIVVLLVAILRNFMLQHKWVTSYDIYGRPSTRECLTCGRREILFNGAWLADVEGDATQHWGDV